jgi:hypothetical protein
MNDRHFHLRLRCTYAGSENKIEHLTVEIHDDNQWEPFDLSVRSAGFLLFINGLLSCQHLYMRTNSAERNLVLESATGELQMVTNEFWGIKEIVVKFNAQLKSGSPTEDDINYITGRMKHCPVSTNLPDSIQIKNSVHFDK